MERSVVDTNSAMAGMFISATVFLTLTAQVVIYLRAIAAQDALWIKATVAIVWMIQCAQMVLSSRMASLYLPSYENDVEAVTMISIEWAVYIGTTSLTVFLVHILFTRRLYILGKCMRVQWNVGIPVGLITLTAQAFALLSVVQILRMERSNPQGLSLLMKLLIPAWLSLVVLADILIAGSLIILLYRNRTGVSRTDHLIKRLIMFCVQTGLITTIAASVTIGVWVAAGFDTRHLFMSFPMGGLYAICLYANFLGRISYLNDKKFTEGTLESDSKVLETIEFSPGRDSLASTV